MHPTHVQELHTSADVQLLHIPRGGMKMMTLWIHTYEKLGFDKSTSFLNKYIGEEISLQPWLIEA